MRGIMSGLDKFSGYDNLNRTQLRDGFKALK
jgi:hypothetical protein